jgi:hypothetical protein
MYSSHNLTAGHYNCDEVRKPFLLWDVNHKFVERHDFLEYAKAEQRIVQRCVARVNELNNLRFGRSKRGQAQHDGVTLANGKK